MTETVARGSDFAELARQINEAGLLRRRTGYHAVKISANVVLVAVDERA